MSIIKGSDVLLQASDGAGGFETLGGLRTKTISLGAGIVDVTHADSGGWRELLPGGGIRRVDLAGSGVFLSDAAADRARVMFFSGEVREWRIVIPGTGRLDGPFQIASLDYAGEYRGEANFSLSLASAGPVVFTEGGA